MTTPTEKGDLLEIAVASIERLILSTSPALKEKTYVIETKKIINAGGVHHEIDIFVTVDPAPGYQSIAIFECKNWTKPVGKNEIVNFSEKINATNANRGFFIAKEFTQDAEAQAAKDSRMSLLQAKDLPLDNPPLLSGFHMTAIEYVKSEVVFKKRGATKDLSEAEALDLDTVQGVFRGQSVDMRIQIGKFGEQAVSRQTLSFRSERLADGKYPQELEANVSFAPGELVLNGHDMELMHLKVDYNVWVFHPAIISHFNVETRGRAMTFAPFDLPIGGSVQVTQATIPSRP